MSNTKYRKGKLISSMEELARYEVKENERSERIQQQSYVEKKSCS